MCSIYIDIGEIHRGTHIDIIKIIFFELIQSTHSTIYGTHYVLCTST